MRANNHPETLEMNRTDREAMPYHVGTTQWGFREWKGVFFSKDASPEQYLSQYASVFSTVEGNTTFYRVPDAETVQRWREAVPADFRFCFKFPKSVTHDHLLRGVEREVGTFLERMEPLRTRLGPFHLQLSDRFSYNRMEDLESFLEQLPAEFSYAVEVRHEDFFDKGRQERYLEEVLRQLNMDRVIFDTRRLHQLTSNDPTILEAKRKKPTAPPRFRTTGSRPFLRYVGGNRWIDNEAWLKEWAIMVANWIREGLHPYVFIHSPDTTSAPELARHFHRELSLLIRLPALPAWPVDRQDRQLGLF